MPIIDNEVDDIFSGRLDVKHQSDLLKSIKRLVEKIQPNDDTELKALLIKLGQSQDRFLVKLNELSKSDVPAQITISNDELAKEINDINKNILAVINKASVVESQEPKEWVFEFNRNRAGFIISPIIAKSK